MRALDYIPSGRTHTIRRRGSLSPAKNGWRAAVQVDHVLNEKWTGDPEEARAWLADMLERHPSWRNKSIGKCLLRRRGGICVFRWELFHAELTFRKWTLRHKSRERKGCERWIEEQVRSHPDIGWDEDGAKARIWAETKMRYRAAVTIGGQVYSRTSAFRGECEEWLEGMLEANPTYWAGPRTVEGETPANNE